MLSRKFDSSSVASQIKALEADLKAKDIAAQEPAAPATKTVRTKKRSKRDDEELMRLLSTFRGKVQKSAVADSDDDADWKTGSLVGHLAESEAQTDPCGLLAL